MLTGGWKAADQCGNASCVEARCSAGGCVEVRCADTACVEVRCASGACVEARSAGTAVQVRDSKDPGGAILSFPGAAWDSFLDGLKDGDFDI